jgi:hypothetical protein
MQDSREIFEITVNDFEQIFSTTLSTDARNFVNLNNFRFRKADAGEVENALIRYIQFLLEDKKVSGPGYKEHWEDGWRENLNKFLASKNLQDLLPLFVRKGGLIRFKQNWIQAEDPEFETSFVYVLRDILYRAHFSHSSSLWEFGCGTGLNLVHANSLFPDKQLIGCDWATSAVDIINTLSITLSPKFTGILFDMFNPDTRVLNTILPNSSLLTIGAMEQLGTNFYPFLDFILKSNFKRIVHVETSYEYYDRNLLFDFLAMKYIEKRGWLIGYFSELTRLQEKGVIRIIDQRKTFGSFFHDGYSITVWEKNV